MDMQKQICMPAAWAGDISWASKLLERGIDVNVKDSINETPLHGAAAWGQEKYGYVFNRSRGRRQHHER